MSIHRTIEELEEQIRGAEVENVTHAQIDAINELAWEIKYQDSKRSLELSQKARSLSEGLLYLKGMAYALRNSAACHWLFADYDSSLSNALEALRLFEEIKDDFGRAHAMNVVGNVHERLGNHTIALEFHRKSLLIRQEIGDTEGASTSLNNLGNVYSSFGEYANALNNYLESLRLYQDINNAMGISRALNNIGYIYTRLEDWDKALEHLHRALELKQQIGDKQNEGLVLVHIGNVYEFRRDFANALEFYTRGLRITQDVGDRQNEASSLNDIGNVYQELGDYQKALSYYTQSLQIAQEVGIKYYETKSLINLGTTLLKLNATKEAISRLNQAIVISEEIKSHDLIYRAHESLSVAYEMTDDLTQSLMHYKSFHQSREKVFSEDSANKIKSVVIQSEVEKSQREAEIYRLRNVELARAYEDIHAANEEKSELVAQLRLQAEALDRQTKEDGLTGIFNRRYLDEQISQEFNRARRFKRDLTVVMADIDNFKLINDKFSHQVGDEVIKTVARILRESCRIIDVVARYGGEEFVMLLIETPVHKARMLCEKIRLAVAEHNWNATAPNLQVTISMGLTDDLTLADPVAMLSDADAMLYKAKHAGRNQIASR